MKILVTGSAGFIGSSLVLKLLNNNFTVDGIDNHNDYYSPKLKEDRLLQFLQHAKYTHYRFDIQNNTILEDYFHKNKPDIVINLAAQAGVQHSIKNPALYINSNIIGFSNIAELSARFNVKHLIYASSSSVYGLNSLLPFSENQNTNHPLSLYAATKKANELIAHSYSHIHGLPCTGLRFFTAYGPWGRPDMALFKFTKAILNNEPIQLFNYGEHQRDFTYIDDITEYILILLNKPPIFSNDWDKNLPDPSTSPYPWKIYNVGNSNPIALGRYVELLEGALGKTAIKELLPLQPGDVPTTAANINKISTELDLLPKTNVELGIRKFVTWYLNYYKIYSD